MKCSQEKKFRKRGPYKQYLSKNGPDCVPRSTLCTRASSSYQNRRRSKSLPESGILGIDTEPLDVPVVPVVLFSGQYEPALSEHPQMGETESVSYPQPSFELEERQSLPLEEPHLLDCSINVQVCSPNFDLSTSFHEEPEDTPADDNSFDNEFCQFFNVDDGCTSEEETCRLLAESPVDESPVNASATVDSPPSHVPDSSPSESSDSEEELAAAPQLHLTVQEKIKMLLLLATKKRHNLSYTAAENIMEFANVFDEDDEAFLPSRHTIKRAIKLYSFSLKEHHVCPVCGLYIGVVEANSFYCSKCDDNFNTMKNRKNGNMFLYLSMEEQLRILLEKCLREEDIIDPCSREKMNRHNYEDLFDGLFYRKNILSAFMSINIFIDGLPIGSTTKASAYPILASVNELPLHLRRKYMMMASVWLSKKKPNCNEYLKPFVQECIKLQTVGVRYKKNSEWYIQKFKVCACISDSVARPTLRNCNQFNGRFGCGLCYHPGIRMPFGRGHVRSYSTRERSYPLRTHEETMQYGRRAERIGAKSVRGIKGLAILSNIPGFDIVTQLDPDSFHCLVNVAKRFTWLWFDERFSKKPFNIHRRLPEVDERLMKITPTSDVSRFRSLTERADYRGHEWYHWILTYSVPCLKKILPTKYLNHWSQLPSALASLLQNSVAKSEVAYSDRYLCKFVSEIDALYGPEHVTFSCHLLTHLSKSVEDFGQPWGHSAYIYEAANKEIKDLIHSSNGAIFQISEGMQLKVAVKNCEYDVRHEMTSKEMDYLKKMTTSATAPVPHCIVENAGLLGKPDVSVLKPELSRAMQRAGVAFDETIPHSVYLRCTVNQEVFQSTLYKKTTKQNNSVALLDDNSIFIIDYFVVLSGVDKCFVLGHFIMENKQQKLCDPVLPHVKVLKKNHECTLRCIPISLILSKLISFSVEISETESFRLAYVNVLSMEMLK